MRGSARAAGGLGDAAALAGAGTITLTVAVPAAVNSDRVEVQVSGDSGRATRATGIRLPSVANAFICA